MPSTRRRQEQSAYQATTTRHHATRSASANQPPVPSITTTVQLDKPLPPSPESQKKKHKPGLLNLIKKKPYDHSDASHLQPAPLNTHRRTSSNGNLSPGLPPHHHQSRSMPSSPLQYSPPHPLDMQRAHSAAAHYPDIPQYQAYTPRPQVTEQQRAVSLGTPFEPIDPRPRRGSTFPESSTISSSTARESISDAPRPHTWVSPTETHAAFGDTTDFHLFAEATAGLPGGFDALSPMETPRLQGSLFARGTQNDRIPLLARETPAQSVPVPVPDYDWMPPQGPRDYSVSSSALPQISSSALPRRDSYDMNGPSSPLRPNLNTINLELERLGLSDSERPPDDELPDYAQSQAEMAAQKRKEASARARELESRWNLARGWRNR
ncbi:uncharacterized protein CC84DRAFT_1100170 [Paraphaeosphaeria sporulosa]|uniref:Uncharacterized protein n=1 Tax=Paraphaeosphaeria sporulosa TaxID=1460663 RepID=A0A177C2V9_9PLEO|nr:uncharacterized protein CC84DRAFT_1100170 [Paraphaeosphaeria sporulosa]OAG01785.1 hypothetical protein CC84DRAFT_1100170 [Paraphaeosphaeria sporulosa]